MLESDDVSIIPQVKLKTVRKLLKTDKPLKKMRLLRPVQSQSIQAGSQSRMIRVLKLIILMVSRVSIPLVLQGKRQMTTKTIKNCLKIWRVYRYGNEGLSLAV